MGFDKEKFISSAKEANYSDEEINAEIARQEGINQATGKPFGEASETAVQGQAQDWRNQGSPVPGTDAPEVNKPSFGEWVSTVPGFGAATGLGALAGAGAVGLYGLAKRRADNGQGLRGAPVVDEEMRQLQLAREQAKLDAMYAEMDRKQQLHEMNLAKAQAKAQPNVSAAPATPLGPAPAPTGLPTAQSQFTVAGQVQPQMQYGQTNTTAPAGALTPLNPVQQPAGEPAIPTAAPKPVDPVVQAKLDAYAAEERRRQLAFDNQQRRLDAEHQAKLDKQVSAAKPKATTTEPIKPITSPAEIPSTDVASRQATQPIVEAGTIKPGKAYGSTDVLDQAALKSQPLIETEKQLEAAGQSKPASKTKAPVVASAEKVAEAAEKAKLKWPGGSEGSALQQFFGATKKTLSPEHMAGLEMFKDYVGGNLAPSTGGTIKEISQANEFVKKYSGSPLPMGENGKLTRLPDEQIAKVNEGIRTELEDAVKGGKLSKLGKGAMAAAALLGLTEAVQAAQKGDFGPLRQAGFDIGGPVLAGKIGLGMLSKAGGAGFAAATYSGGLNEGEQRELARRRYEFEKESKKLGSPYRSVPPPR